MRGRPSVDVKMIEKVDEHVTEAAGGKIRKASDHAFYGNSLEADRF